MGKKENKKRNKDNEQNKDNTEIVLNKSEKKSKSSCCRILLILTSVITLAVAVASYQVYVKLTTPPDMPQLDFNAWWGPNTTRQQDTSIRPFKVMFTDARHEHLRKKFELYRSSVIKRKSLNDSWSYGINSDAFAQIFAYWQFNYQFRDRERFMNQFDQFKTNIQGLDIHFLHARPKVEESVKVLPLLILHGWPGSIREFYEAIPLLTTVRPGYDFVFEVIIPSVPGFVYSQAPSRQGLGPVETAIVMRNLMKRIGFTQYFIQGGDYGHNIGSHIATIFPNEVLGFHTNFPGNFMRRAGLAYVLGAFCPSLVADGMADRMYPLEDKVHFVLEEFAYMHFQGTKPDTLGIALQDSPVGLAAYIIDKFMIFTDPNNKDLQDGGLSKYYTMTDLLDNVNMYWFSGSITSSLRMYKESFLSAELEQTLAEIPTTVPSWGLRLKYELIQQPDFILRWKYQNLLGSTNLDFGGHFAAFERPKEYADDVFLAVKSFQEYHRK